MMWMACPPTTLILQAPFPSGGKSLGEQIIFLDFDFPIFVPKTLSAGSRDFLVHIFIIIAGYTL